MYRIKVSFPLSFSCLPTCPSRRVALFLNRNELIQPSRFPALLFPRLFPTSWLPTNDASATLSLPFVLLYVALHRVSRRKTIEQWNTTDKMKHCVVLPNFLLLLLLARSRFLIFRVSLHRIHSISVSPPPTSLSLPSSLFFFFFPPIYAIGPHLPLCLRLTFFAL